MTTVKKRVSVWLSATLSTLLLSACGQSDADLGPLAYQNEIMEWRQGRLEQLLQPQGYLNQTGLYWLEPGSYSFGTSADNDLVFTGSGADRIGRFTVGDDQISMQVEPGVEVLHEGNPIEQIVMVPDTGEQPVTVVHRTLGWAAIEREGRFGIRLRDFELPFVKTFGPLPYFDIDPEYRVQAKLLRYPEPITSSNDTVIEGLMYRPESPGIVEFEIDGQQFQLEAFSSGDRLFYVFGDQTNRDMTYGAGRFLYSETPGDNGLTILDFNKSYSPPCAFNDFSTCPVASPRNRMQVRIEAGEIYDANLHYAADH